MDKIHREPKQILLKRVPDKLPEIQRAWPELENLVGLHGRKFYGIFDEKADEYLVATEVRPDDPRDHYGLEVGELAGGSYLRLSLHGEPPAVYGEIGPGFDQLHAAAKTDPERPQVEFYRRHNEIELWLPISARSAE
jgi:hypothetical protein